MKKLHRTGRKIIWAIVVMAISVILSGCVRVSIDMTLKKDGRADMSAVFAISDMAYSLSGEYVSDLDISEEDRRDLKRLGMTIDIYSSEGYSGYRMEGHNIDLQSVLPVMVADARLQKDGSIYQLYIPLCTESEYQEMKDSYSLLSALGGYFKVVINLEEMPLDHNATSVLNGGRTLQWDVISPEPIYVKYQIKEASGLTRLWGSGARLRTEVYVVALLLVLFVTVIIVLAKNHGEWPWKVRSAASGPADPPAGAGNAGGGKYCANCHAPLAEDEAFCPKCGTKYEPPSCRKCPSCGRLLKEAEVFCPGCGTRYPEEAQKEAEDRLPAVPDGEISEGAVSENVVSEGAVSEDVVSGGAISGGVVCPKGKVCPNCGEVNEEEAVFCGGCGFRLE